MDNPQRFAAAHRDAALAAREHDDIGHPHWLDYDCPTCGGHVAFTGDDYTDPRQGEWSCHGCGITTQLHRGFWLMDDEESRFVPVARFVPAAQRHCDWN